MAQRLALFIGIGEYADTSYAGRQPSCCCGDTQAFAALLRENEPRTANPNFRLLGGEVVTTPDQYDPIDPEVGSAALTERVRDLFAVVRRGDALLYFTGHAIPIDGGSNLLLLTPDDTPNTRRGIRISDVRDATRRSQASSITIILDCCHSGIAATMEWPRNTTVMTSTDEHTASQALYGTHLMYTSALMAALRGGAADVQGVITPLSLHSTVCGMLNLGEDGQQPVLRTWSDTLTVLRQVDSSRELTLDELARIVPTLSLPFQHRREYIRSFDDIELPVFRGFSTASAIIAVHPEHESPRAREGVLRTGRETWNDLDDLQRDMELFKHLRNAKLLEAFIRGADGSDRPTDLFWACLAEWDADSGHSTGEQGYVRLTELGRLYWEIQHKR
ncbi:caspase family protein [Bifidobacterium callitrichos]|uniref:Caspase family protein n=1 Tax=Bifidobacterium callitrichos TaxID=762209 RepID=A0A5M9ZF90_9BIFI|nr:caspase family protein [Bifidobacterium callitrichos]KAA8817615.1 caspase family protein [Bifidobacterium callitrichos]